MRNRLTEDAPTLFISQYGEGIRAASLKELRAKVAERYGTRAAPSKQYVDGPNGTVWNGYVIGHVWLTAFKWQEVTS